MTEEEQQQEVAVWGENMNLMKDCSLEKTDEDLYYNTEWDYTCEESELEPEDKNDPDVHKEKVQLRWLICLSSIMHLKQNRDIWQDRMNSFGS